MKNGIYINEKEFVRFSEPKASMTTEIATRSRSIDFFGLSMYLPNPDPVLKKQGKDIGVYRDLMVDDRIKGSWGNRRAATMSLEWEINRGEKGKTKNRQVRAIQELFERLDLSRIMTEILEARLYGYQPMEVLWEKRDGLLLPRDIVAKPQEWFQFDAANALRFRSRESGLQGEELPPYAFLCPTSDASYYNPYGLALLASCFWPVTFKKGGWRFWVTFAEKYGQAFAVGKIRRGATKEEMEELADMLDRMIQDAVAVIYDDSSVELTSVDAKGASADLFQGIITEANTAITTAILGHAGAGQSTSGKLGSESAAVEVREDFKDDDKKLVCQTMNQLIRWINELNWNGPDVPLFGLWEEEDVDTAQAERDEKLSASMEKSGLKLTKGYYLRTYNLEEGDVEDKQGPATRDQGPVQPITGVQFTDGWGDRRSLSGVEGQDAIDAFISSFTNEDLQGEMKTVLMPLINDLQQNGDYAGAMETLAGAYPQMNTDSLQEMLTRMIFVSEIMGRLDGSD